MNLTSVLLKLTAPLAALLIAAPAMAVVDQVYLPTNASFCTVDCVWEQSFTAGMSGELSGIRVFDSGGNVTLNIGNGPGPINAGWLAHLSAVDTSGMIDLSSYHIQVAAGQTYVFEISHASSWLLGSYVAGGDQAGTLFLSMQGSAYAPYADWNLAYVTDVTAVPEPGSLGMMFAGLGLVGFIARRRRQ